MVSVNLAFEIQERSETAVYQQIGQQIKAYLLENASPPGTMLPNVRKIAALANVSLRTADLALTELVKEGICSRRPKKGTFVADPLRAATRRRICLVTLPLGHETIATSIVDAILHRGMITKACFLGVDVLITDSARTEDAVSAYAASREMSLQGVVLTRGCDIKVVNRVAKERPAVKFVYANYRPKGFEDTGRNVCGVFNDEFGGAYHMALPLLCAGHRQFAVFSWDVDDENYRIRVKGFAAALAEQGIDLPDSMIFHRSGDRIDDRKAFGHDTARKLLAKRGHPTAILCVNDQLAQGACRAVQELGLEGKIGVTGFDNIISGVRDEYHFPTAAIDFEGIGAKALEVIAANGVEYPKEIRIQPDILNRQG